MLGGIYEDLLLLGQGLAGEGIYVAYCLNRIAEEIKADRKGFIRRVQLDHIASNPECPTGEIDIVSCVLQICQSSEQLVPFHGITDPYGDHRGLVILG